jgi:hypothetical protein
MKILRNLKEKGGIKNGGIVLKKRKVSCALLMLRFSYQFDWKGHTLLPSTLSDLRRTYMAFIGDHHLYKPVAL